LLRSMVNTIVGSHVGTPSAAGHNRSSVLVVDLRQGCLATCAPALAVRCVIVSRRYRVLKQYEGPAFRLGVSVCVAPSNAGTGSCWCGSVSVPPSSMRQGGLRHGFAQSTTGLLLLQWARSSILLPRANECSITKRSVNHATPGAIGGRGSQTHACLVG